MRFVKLIFLLPLASTALAAAPSLTLKTDVEDNKKMIVATVVRDGQPLAGVSVSFYIVTSFGRMLLGKDQTLDDGSAAVAAPEGMPGGPGGELKVVAQAALPESANVEMKASVDVAAPAMATQPASPAPTPPAIIDAFFAYKSEVKILREQEPNPRALWAPRAPVLLLTIITGILVAVWGTYVFVVSQLIKIKLGAKT